MPTIKDNLDTSWYWEVWDLLISPFTEPEKNFYQEQDWYSSEFSADQWTYDDAEKSVVSRYIENIGTNLNNWQQLDIKVQKVKKQAWYNDIQYADVSGISDIPTLDKISLELLQSVNYDPNYSYVVSAKSKNKLDEATNTKRATTSLAEVNLFNGKDVDGTTIWFDTTKYQDESGNFDMKKYTEDSYNYLNQYNNLAPLVKQWIVSDQQAKDIAKKGIFTSESDWSDAVSSLFWGGTEEDSAIAKLALKSKIPFYTTPVWQIDDAWYSWAKSIVGDYSADLAEMARRPDGTINYDLFSRAIAEENRLNTTIAGKALRISTDIIPAIGIAAWAVAAAPALWIWALGAWTVGAIAWGLLTADEQIYDTATEFDKYGTKDFSLKNSILSSAQTFLSIAPLNPVGIAGRTLWKIWLQWAEWLLTSQSAKWILGSTVWENAVMSLVDAGLSVMQWKAVDIESYLLWGALSTGIVGASLARNSGTIWITDAKVRDADSAFQSILNEQKRIKEETGNSLELIDVARQMADTWALTIWGERVDFSTDNANRNIIESGLWLYQWLIQQTAFGKIYEDAGIKNYTSLMPDLQDKILSNLEGAGITEWATAQDIRQAIGKSLYDQSISGITKQVKKDIQSEWKDKLIQLDQK